MPEVNPDRNIVAAITDHDLDKYSLLEKVLGMSGSFENLDESWKNSGKSKKDFKSLVKPNISMMLRRSDIGAYTGPLSKCPDG